jgi:hypothetical protein
MTARLVIGGGTPDLSQMSLGDITTDTMRAIPQKYGWPRFSGAGTRGTYAHVTVHLGADRDQSRLSWSAALAQGPSSAAPQLLPLRSAAGPTRGGS